MKHKGIPFFAYSTTSDAGSDEAKGVRVSVLYESHKDGTYQGVLIGGLVSYVENGVLEGVGLGGLFNLVDVGSDLTGVGVGGIGNLVSGDLKGVGIGGVFSHVRGSLNGISYGTAVNWAGKNKGNITVQIGAINILKEYSGDGSVFQLGLYNRIDGQAVPVVNFKRKR